MRLECRNNLTGLQPIETKALWWFQKAAGLSKEQAHLAKGTSNNEIKRWAEQFQS